MLIQSTTVIPTQKQELILCSFIKRKPERMEDVDSVFEIFSVPSEESWLTGILAYFKGSKPIFML